MGAATHTGRSDVDPADLKPFEPLMDAILQPYEQELPDDRPYDEFGIADKARYLTGIVRGRYQVRDDVTYDTETAPGEGFTMDGLYSWLQAVSGRPRDGSKPFQEMLDVPEEHRTGNEAALVSNLRKRPAYPADRDELAASGLTDSDVEAPDRRVGNRRTTTLDFEEW